MAICIYDQTFSNLYVERKAEFSQLQTKLGLDLYVDFIDALFKRVPHIPREMPLVDILKIFDEEFAKFKKEYQ